jgi:hypothetical protein
MAKNRKQKMTKSEAFTLGFVFAMFTLIVTMGIIYGARTYEFDFSKIQFEANASSSSNSTAIHERGVSRIKSIAEGDLQELKMDPNFSRNFGAAYCQINIEGKPEDFVQHWDGFFSRLSERKNIQIFGWEFRRGLLRDQNRRKETIKGVMIQYSLGGKS